jgi:dienelactone hydrolase
MKKEIHSPTRRDFVKTSVGLAATAPFAGSFFSSAVPVSSFENRVSMLPVEDTKSIIGHYGAWAAGLRADPPALSLRANRNKKLANWRKEATAKTLELVARPSIGPVPKVMVEKKYTYDGLDVEELAWQLPYGRSTKAILLKPRGANKKLPAILGLHDHGGNKFFGKDKITRISEAQHPLMKAHQAEYYEGKAWANEIAKRGYVVLVADTCAFGSRRVHYEDMAGITWGTLKDSDKQDSAIKSPEEIATYNAWAADHEHVLSKSLFCAGTTWPGVTLAEDQMALTILSQRPEVDSERLGCMGLSGGGLRTVYLGGLDERIKCAVPVGFMSTWNDFLLHKAYTHTWMIYTPLLPNYLEFPEILGLRVPLPTLVLNNNQDQLYTLPEMRRSDEILREVYQLAGASDAYRTTFYDGEHKFDAAMQGDAFAWFDQWLG